MHGDTIIPVRIGLTQSNLELAENMLRDVSDPASPKYSVPLNVTEHIDYIVPGVKPLTVRRRPIAAAGTERDGHNLNELGFPWEDIRTNISMCSTAVTPACVRGESSPSHELVRQPTSLIDAILVSHPALYNIPRGSKAAKGNELGIVAQLDAYSQEDFEDYSSIVAPEISANACPAVKSINGGVAPVPAAKAGIESNLDLMTAAPIIWPQRATIFQVDDPAYQADYSYPGFLNNFLDAIDDSYCEGHDSSLDPQYPHERADGYRGPKHCGTHKPTNVIAISYANSEDHLPPSYQTRQCHEWLKLGLQGVTVIVASGDAGVQSDIDEHEGCLNGGKSFSPQFPASCPFVTTVGATALPKGAAPIAGSEVASFNFASGGGFSNIFARPHWQDKLVESYFKEHDPKYEWHHSNDSSSETTLSGVYNRTGRAYPDVAAIGQAIPIVLKGEVQLEHGTSASAPYFASIISLINEERLAANLSTVGFINPVLYANPQVFNDVTSGHNQGCGTDGFHAVEGWDPVTELGTPNYQKLLELFMKRR
ncbi:hypothetical protein KEM54_003071 [Ascosphaera aggregata]|nr:hypothetical protein KEM54_003071 [Ascosphaera aggregata]